MIFLALSSLKAISAEVSSINESSRVLFPFTDLSITLGSIQPMIPQVKKILLEQRERQMRNKEFLKDAYISNDYVCTFDNGKEITPNYLTKKFHTLIEKQNDFPQIRFHDLRHSVASNLLNDGFTTVQVAEWLGHSSSTTTLKFYAHIDKTSKLAIANSLQAD